MLKDADAEYAYREYTKDPLTAEELREVLGLLGMSASQVFRKRDAANKILQLSGNEDDEILIAHMVDHPTLLQRPIAVRDGRAVLGRPVENILSLL